MTWLAGHQERSWFRIFNTLVSRRSLRLTQEFDNFKNSTATVWSFSISLISKLAFFVALYLRERTFFLFTKVTKWLAHLPIGGSPRVGPKPGRTGSGSGGIFPPARNLRDSAHCSSCWPKLPFGSNSSAFLFWTGTLFLFFFVSGRVGVRSRFQPLGAPCGADMLQRAGDVWTWRFQNIHNPTAKNGIISKGFLQQKVGRNAFLILATFPCERVRLWPMTRDRCSQLMRSDAASGGR